MGRTILSIIMDEFRYGVLVTGICKICSRKGKTEIHHIISQSVISRIERPDLLTNPGNLVELCKECHKLTDSHVYRRWIKGQNPKIETKEQKRERVRIKRQRRRERKGLFQCSGYTRTSGGRRCEAGVKEEGGLCSIHRKRRKSKS
tara:strand:- start:2189 stop:2626 length:438 start_codon:yes stop_codon:yes gene_type:complete